MPATGRMSRKVVRPVLQVPLTKLRPAEWNANRVPKNVLRKMKRSITRFGFVENLVVRPHPVEKDAYEVLSGNHRLLVLMELGFESAPVVVLKLSDPQARLLAQTMNRARGRDDPFAYQQLLDELLAELDLKEIAGYLPEVARSLSNAESRPSEANAASYKVFGVIADCSDAADQAALLTKMTEEGRSCRPLLA